MLLTFPLTGCTEETENDTTSFPQFSSVADNGQTYDNARMAGSPFIVVFSAEWCNNPCYTTMHTIWNAEAELPVLVMSTDPAENASGYTLQDWHESADAHDDNGDDKGVNLTTYAFMKGVEAGEKLGITSPGTVIFVNGNGDITYQHTGRMDDSALVKQKWTEAGG